MASLNESLFNTPSAKRALKIHEARVNEAVKVRKARGLDTTMEQKMSTAICLENTRQRLRAFESFSYPAYNGATQPSNIGQYKRFALDMVATLVPNLIAPELVSVQAIDNRVGMINILEYQYGDTKGAAKRGQVFSSPLGYQGTDSEYTSAQTTEKIDSTIQTALAGEGYTPAWGPVTKAYVITSEGVKDVEITTEEDGGLQSKTYKSVLKNSDAKEGDTLVYLYDNETVPVDAPEIKLDIRSLPIETRSRKLKAVWSFDAEYELNKEYGVEMSASLASQATAEIGQEIDTEIMNDLYRAANSGPEIVWSRTQPAGVSQIDHYDSFYTELVRGSNQIFGATRRSRANWMVCGLGVLAVLKVMRNFDDAEDLTAIGPHFVGTIGGIRVFVNPWFDENVFVLGYKGPNMVDAGYVYAPYMPIMTTGMVTLADDFAARQGWATQYGTKLINPRLYVRGRII